jgi:ABC-type multidrug transport system ATPase subunit
MKECLHIDSVFLDFGERSILRGISLQICRGQVVGLLGRNGSGKSCLLNIIVGLLRPQYRQIRWAGAPPGLIHYLPQQECHPRAMCVRTLLKYYGIDARAFIEHHPFIQDQLERPFGKLSGGQRRMLEVLLVLESNASYVLLDEPFSHLMPMQVEAVQSVIARVKEDKGILLTDHQYRSVLKIADELYLLKEGILKPVKDIIDLQDQGYIR